MASGGTDWGRRLVLTALSCPQPVLGKVEIWDIGGEP